MRRIEEGTRRLAATIVHCYDKPVRDIELARSDLEEITSALNSLRNTSQPVSVSARCRED